jgi:hypothetical protein
MRSYPRNSPEAAGRIVALVLLADGHVCSSEVEALRRLDAERVLGLQPEGMQRLLQQLAEDLMDGLCATGSLLSSLDEATLRALMREVDSPPLQRQVLLLVHAAVAADQHLAQAEQVVLDAARRHWPQADIPPAQTEAAALAA